MNRLFIILFVFIFPPINAVNFDNLHQKILAENWKRRDFVEYFDNSDFNDSEKINQINWLISEFDNDGKYYSYLSYLYNIKGYILLDNGKKAEAIDCMTNAIQFSFLMNNTSYTKTLYIELSDYLVVGGLYNDAIEYGELILNKYPITRKDSADIYSILGASYCLVHDYYKSIDYHTSSAELYLMLNDSVKVASQYYNLGVVLDKVGRIRKSINFLNESLSIWDQLGDEAEKLKVELFIGNAFLDKKRYRKAIKIFSSVLSKRDEYPELFDNISGKTELCIAYAYLFNNQIDSSKYWFSRAIESASDNENNRLLVKSYIGLHNLCKHSNNQSEHNCYLELAESLVDTTNFTYEDAVIYSELASAYYEKGDFKKSLVYFKLKQKIHNEYELLKDNYNKSLYDNKQQLINQQSEYKSVIKGKEKWIKAFKSIGVFILIAVFFLMILLWYLKVKNKLIKNNLIEISTQKKLLEEANATKKTMLSIIGHDLKGPIGTTSQLLEIVINYIEECDYSRAKIILKELKNTSEDIYSMLNSLLLWANAIDNRIEIKRELVDVVALVNNCLLSLKSCIKNKNIKVVYESEDKLSCKVDSNIVSVVLRNLISNAIKYSYQGGVVEVSTQVIENRLFIEIKDSGIGMSVEKVNSLFDGSDNCSTLGTSKEVGTGIGLKLCKLFVDALGGEISCKSELEIGTVFFVSIPV